MTSLVEYKIFCVTEDQVIRGYTSTLLTPTCPHNHSHIVLPGTLIKVAEVLEQQLEEVQFCQATTYQLDVASNVGSTGLDIPFGLPVNLHRLSYPGQTGIAGDLLNGYIVTESGTMGATAIAYLHNLPLNQNGGSIEMSVNIPRNGINRLVYTNIDAGEKVFKFQTDYCY